MPRLADIAALRRETALSYQEKWFFVCLLELSDEQGRCHRSLRELARETFMSYGQISTMVKHLAALGYLRHTIAAKDGRHTTLLFLTEKGLLPEGVPRPPRHVIDLPGPAQIEAGNVRITVVVEPREPESS